MIHPDEENMFCVHQQTELFLFNIFLNYCYVHQTQKNVFNALLRQSLAVLQMQLKS